MKSSGPTLHLATAVAALCLAATPVQAAHDIPSEGGGEKPRPEQAATPQAKAETKTAPNAEVEPKVKAAPKDGVIRNVRIEVNLISIKNGEKVRSGI